MIAVCGEALVDFTPAAIGGETAYLPQAGGSPRNVAVGLARLGVACSFLGKISNDAFGQMLADDLFDNGVDLSNLVRSELPSALAFVLEDGDGGEAFQFYGEGTADQDLSADEVPEGLFEDVEAVHFGSYSMVLGRTGSTLRSLMRSVQGQTVVLLDPNVRPSLLSCDAYLRRIESLVPFANLVKVSQQDLSWLFLDEQPEDVARRWLDLGPDVVVVTHGGRGAIGYTRRSETHSPGVSIEVADTVGAGDAFTAGLLAQLLGKGLLSQEALATISERPLTDAIAYANRVASLACTRIGASPPTTDELASKN